jgi:hypothetical protein
MSIRSEYRKSQGVVPFGVGAIIDFADESLMAAGLDAWPIEWADPAGKAAMLRTCRVVDGRLAARLSADLGRRIDYFLTPNEAPELGVFGVQARPDRQPMPFVRFPQWYFCPRCRKLKKIAWNAGSKSDLLRCDNTGRRAEGKGEVCGNFKSTFRRPKLSPVRFVIACEHGHITDFPWSAWAHSRSDKTCLDREGNLYLFSTVAAGLAGVMVECTSCGAKRSMAGAFQKDIMSDIVGQCPGERPWLGPGGVQACTQIPQTIQRGASNAYFAKVVSSILIPPYSIRIQQVLDRPDVWREIEALPLVDGKLYEPWLRTRAENLGEDPDAFVRAVHERLDAKTKTAEGEPATAETSEASYRYDEYKAYLGSRPPAQERQDFDIRAVPASAYAEWFHRFFDQVVLVTRLRETRALTGFSRIMPVEALQGVMAELSIKPKNWLPGFAVRGEGVFIKFSESALRGWRSDQSVLHRTEILQRRLDEHKRERRVDPRPITPELVLMHTFAHLLIRQLAFECGYDTSSIRERLYVDDDPQRRMAGVLFYTASGDSEGTLGGLVRQGEPTRFDNTIRAAVRNASICSSDPLCIESEGQGTNSLNLAACHACSLLPETSCEEGNLLLDRALVLGTPDRPATGFLHELAG